MKKGDRVIVKSTEYSCTSNAIFHHEYDGIYYVFAEFNPSVLYGYKFCKPVKQSVEEWSDRWLDENTNEVYPKWRKLIHKYYEDRKKWENE